MSLDASTSFMGEIGIASFNFAPKGWAECNGQLLPISQNEPLFSLLGTTFGGDGRTTFGLPNLQGRVPIHTGGGWSLGDKSGEEFHTITLAETPTHTHFLNATNVSATAGSPSTARVLAQSNGANVYAAATNLQPMASNAITGVGGTQAHENRQPFLVLNFCIALSGIFPSQN